VSTDELRRQLGRIADAAPQAVVPDDTWTRARRSVVRERVAVGGAVLAVMVAGVAAGMTWLPDRAEPPVADTERGAIPSRIWTAPEGQPLTTAADLAVGPVAAVYLGSAPSDGARAVAISATDGSYTSLTLPDPDGDDAIRFGWNDQVIALSPDGSQLAYSFFPSSGSVGVGVVDLVTGTVRIVRLGIGVHGLVRRLIWSPGGEYLIWWGQPHTSTGLGDTMAGLIDPGATTSTELPVEPRQDDVRNYAVDDAGRVFLIDNHRVRTWRDGEIISSRPGDFGSTYSGSAQTVGGELVEARLPFATDEAPTGDPALLVRSGDRSVTSGPFPSSLYGWDVLGWTASGAAIVDADTDAEGSSNKDLYRVELDGDGAVTSTRIVTLESGLDPEKLTVASDLPVREVAAPDWAEKPWWTHADVVIGLGVAGAIAVLMGLRWLWRRYRVARYAS
jgi:hypothetical protein